MFKEIIDLSEIDRNAMIYDDINELLKEELLKEENNIKNKIIKHKTNFNAETNISLEASHNA